MTSMLQDAGLMVVWIKTFSSQVLVVERLAMLTWLRIEPSSTDRAIKSRKNTPLKLGMLRKPTSLQCFNADK